VSEVDIKLSSGMGRVEYYWKQALERLGYVFMHIGPEQIGPIRHQSLFPYKAYRYYKKLNIKPVAFIVHEPAASYFVNKGIPCFLESHGIERRNWENQLNGIIPLGVQISFRTKLLFPLWRLHGCDKGLRYADKLLLINSDDQIYAKKKYARTADDVFLFRNGVSNFEDIAAKPSSETFTVLFNGTWIERKGTFLLVKAAEMLFQRGLNIKYLLIGAGKDEQTVMNDWPEALRPYVSVVSSFPPKMETEYLSWASIVVLPSYFEGQPLSLLQAMAAGKCCISTNSCGQKDIIDNGQTGLLFEVGEETAFAAHIETCFYDRDLVQRIGMAAKSALAERTWENVSNELAEYISANI